MEHYSIEYQYEMSVNWYLLDQDDCVVHFDAAGGIVPDFIAANAADNEVLHAYFTTLAPCTVPLASPFLSHYVDFAQWLGPREAYVGYYASRGLIDFDKLSPGPGSHEIAYFQVATPMAPLTLHDVPEAIKNRLLRVRQPIRFQDFHRIDAGYAPWAALFTDYFRPMEYSAKPVRKSKWFDRLFS